MPGSHGSSEIGTRPRRVISGRNPSSVPTRRLTMNRSPRPRVTSTASAMAVSVASSPSTRTWLKRYSGSPVTTSATPSAPPEHGALDVRAEDREGVDQFACSRSARSRGVHERDGSTRLSRRSTALAQRDGAGASARDRILRGCPIATRIRRPPGRSCVSRPSRPTPRAATPPASGSARRSRPTRRCSASRPRSGTPRRRSSSPTGPAGRAAIASATSARSPRCRSAVTPRSRAGSRSRSADMRTLTGACGSRRTAASSPSRSPRVPTGGSSRPSRPSRRGPASRRRRCWPRSWGSSAGRRTSSIRRCRRPSRSPGRST